MPKAALLALLALTLATVFHLTAVTLLLVPLLAAALIGYWRLLTRRPYTTCRPCRGTGYRRSRLFAHSAGYCPDCTGTGIRPRLGQQVPPYTRRPHSGDTR